MARLVRVGGLAAFLAAPLGEAAGVAAPRAAGTIGRHHGSAGSLAGLQACTGRRRGRANGNANP